MNRLLFLPLFSLSLFTIACSGGASNGTPPPKVGTFTNSNLRGNYAFSMSGQDGNGAFITRIGSFIADGSGKISNAI